MIQVCVRAASVVLATSLALAGCATSGTAEKSNAGKVDSNAAAIAQKRAIERWDLLISHQAEKAYDYLSPGYRGTKKREEYAAEMNSRPVGWSKVYPSTEICDKPDVCTISLAVEYEVKMPGVGKPVNSIGYVTETWIKSKGKWWHLPGATK